MYNKIKNFAESCWENRIMFRIFLICFIFWGIVTCVIATVQGNWNTMFIYPEEEYAEIQAEADRIISSHNFETSYELQITNYSNINHNLSFDIRGSNSSLLTVKVSNYGLENEEISYSRFTKSPTTHILLQLLAVILLIVLFAMVSGLAILIIISIIWFVAFIIHKIIECSNNKNSKDKK